MWQGHVLQLLLPSHEGWRMSMRRLLVDSVLEHKSDKDVYINTSMCRWRAVDARAPHLRRPALRLTQHRRQAGGEGGLNGMGSIEMIFGGSSSSFRSSTGTQLDCIYTLTNAASAAAAHRPSMASALVSFSPSVFSSIPLPTVATTARVCTSRLMICHMMSDLVRPRKDAAPTPCQQ